MKKTVFRIAAACSFALAASAPVVWAHEGMMGHGNFAYMFDQMDANHDGVVTKKEFDAFHDKRFKELDANHDGKITREEMAAAHGEMMGHMREQFKKRFEEADANHDGALNKEEAQKLPFVAQHFDEIDANHDGKVTLDEMEAAHQKMHGPSDMGHGDGMCGSGAMHSDCMMK